MGNRFYPKIITYSVGLNRISDRDAKLAYHIWQDVYILNSITVASQSHCSCVFKYLH